ncbi:MAG: hypothetical protein QXR26_03205 [Candidatus Caldarchaeum sp.]
MLAVATAVRLAKKGERVTIVYTGRRLGLFPFAVLTKKFLKEVGVEPLRHSEAVVKTCYVDGRSFRLPTPLYLCRTTPLLEDAISYNEVKFSHRMPQNVNEEVVDCNPKFLKDLRLVQVAFVTRHSSDDYLAIESKPYRHFSATLYSEKKAVSYIYFVDEVVKPAGLLAAVERCTGYVNRFNGEVSAAAGLAGQDVAETINDRDVVEKNVKYVLNVLKGFKPEPAEDIFSSVFTCLA